MIIGLTGGSGTGKSTVSAYFKEKGYTVIDGDALSREITTKGSKTLEKITEAFGAQYLNADGELKRRELGALVFQDSKALETLNHITHSAITEKVKEILAKTNKATIEGAAIFECDIYKLCDITLFVSCPKEERIKRIMARDNLSYAYAKSRIEAQKSDEYYRKMCDFEIVNDGKQDIKRQLEALNID